MQEPVSYTHLDVYKRQTLRQLLLFQLRLKSRKIYIVMKTTVPVTWKQLTVKTN